MSRHWTLGLLTCGPFALALAAWAGQIWIWRRQKPGWMTLVALGLFGASASLAAWTFFSYDFRPSSNQPPWRDPEILNFGLLFFPVLVEMILAFGAILRGAPKSMMANVAVAASQRHGRWGLLIDGAQWWSGLFPKKGEERYFGTEAGLGTIDNRPAKVSATCCGVNLAVGDGGAIRALARQAAGREECQFGTNDGTEELRFGKQLYFCRSQEPKLLAVG